MFPGFFLPFDNRQLLAYEATFSAADACAKGIECLHRKKISDNQKIYYCDNQNKITLSHKNNYAAAFDIMYRVTKDLYQKWDTLLPTQKVIKFYETVKDGRIVICADVIEDDPFALHQIFSKLGVLKDIYPSRWYMPYVFRFFSGEKVTKEYFYNRELDGYQEMPIPPISDYPTNPTITYSLPCYRQSASEPVKVWYHETCISNCSELSRKCPCCDNKLTEVGEVETQDSKNLFGKICLSESGIENYVFFNVLK